MRTAVRPVRMTGDWVRSKRNLSGCVLYLPFWQPDLRADAFFSKDPTRYGVQNYGSTWTSQGRSFDGDNDDMILGAASTLDPLNIIGDMTIVAWVKAIALEASSDYFLQRGRYQVDGYYIGLDIGNARLFLELSQLGLDTPVAPALNTLSTTVFTHTTFRKVGTVGDCFIDGVLSETAFSPVTVIHPTPAARLTYVCSYEQTINFFPMIIGELLIYSRGFSATEIRDDWLSTKGRWQ